MPEPIRGETREIVGKAVGVGARSIDFATRVLTTAVPELVKAVDEGRVAVSAAAAVASEPPEQQRELAASPRGGRLGV